MQSISVPKVVVKKGGYALLNGPAAIDVSLSSGVVFIFQSKLSVTAIAYADTSFSSAANVLAEVLEGLARAGIPPAKLEASIYAHIPSPENNGCVVESVVGLIKDSGVVLKHAEVGQSGGSQKIHGDTDGLLRVLRG